MMRYSFSRIAREATPKSHAKSGRDAVRRGQRVRAASLLFALAFVVASVFAASTPAEAAALKWSYAKDRTVTTDMNGWATVKIRYADKGYLGNSVKKVCVKAKQHLTKSAKIDLYMGDRSSAGTFRWTFKQFTGLADGSWECKRTSEYKRSLRVDDAWRWKGTFSGPYCVGSFCPFLGHGAASGRM